MKLIDALKLVGAADPKTPEYPVQLIYGGTSQPLLTFLAAHLQTRLSDRRVTVAEGTYGDFLGNLSRYMATQNGVAACVIEWEDLDSRLGWRHHAGWGRRCITDIRREVSRKLDVVHQILSEREIARTIALSLPTLPIPPVEPLPSWEYGPLQCWLDQLASEFSSKWVSHNRVRIVNAAHLARNSPINQRLDVKSSYQGGAPFLLAHADAVAELLARLLQPSAPMKGIITDLDGTLWSGILGEVGVNAVEWDLDHRAAHHGIYQQLLQSLADSGVLLAIATKNDPGLVQTVLAERRLLVKSEALFPVVASWGPKSVSVSQILESWNVGAECVVFIDDSDLELAEVKTAHPAIECKKFEKDPGQISSLVWDLVNKFGTRFDSAEDGYRLESLRAGAEFKSQITGAESMEAMHVSSNGILRLVAISNPPDPRSLELINKTNQFNLNGRRWTDLEWQEYLTTPGCVAWLGSYEDRYGPLGKITVIAGRLDGQRELKVDVWVMSCRAFSRRIEFALLSELYQRCDIERISFQYCQTDRNGPLTEALCSVLGSPPQTGCYLAKEQFDPRKPAWYLKVE